MNARDRPVTVRVGGEVRRGRAIDLRAAFDAELVPPELAPEEVASAIRSADDPDRAVVSESGRTIAVDCPAPGPAHEHVGVIRDGTDLSLRGALAAAARSQGHGAPEADELEAIRARLGERDAVDVSGEATLSGGDLRQARRRVAEANDEEAEIRERVATLQGRVQALRDAGVDGAPETGDAEAELSEATRRLSEVQTERIAAEQALARCRERARTHRERRRERLRLQDRAGNLRRAAREHLAGLVRESFEDARDEIPDTGDLGESVETALAVARVAELDAPVVLAHDADPFETVEDVARWIDGTVIRA